MADESLNYLLPSKASLQVHGAQTFSINVQNFKIPRMYGYVSEQPTPLINAPLPGNKLVYDLLEVSFLVTENIASWKELHDWMRGIYAPMSRDEYKNKKLYLQDATLTIYTSANNPAFRIKFIDLFPVRIDEIIFDVEMPSADPVKTKVEFTFLRFEVETL